MAICVKCSRKLGFFEAGSGGLCSACAIIDSGAVDLDQIEIGTLEVMEWEENIEAIILTTEGMIDRRVRDRLEIVSAEVAFGQHIFRDLFVAARDVFGGRSAAVQNTLRQARQQALYELKREAHLIGANAVIGVDLKYVELSSHSTMVLLVATGTAVILE